MTETTPLTPEEERAFQMWAQQNGIRDVNAPDARYDYRGFWKQTHGAAHPSGEQQHFPDTFKQHGHPTFSVESQYSAGPFDGGRWNGDAFVPPGADLLQTSHGSRMDPQLIAQAIRVLATHLQRSAPRGLRPDEEAEQARQLAEQVIRQTPSLQPGVWPR